MNNGGKARLRAYLVKVNFCTYLLNLSLDCAKIVLIGGNGYGSTLTIMRQKTHEKGARVGECIQLNLMCSATVVGRTYEEEPKIDLRTPWGTLNGIPQSILDTMGLPIELKHDNVERIRPSRAAAGDRAPARS